MQPTCDKYRHLLNKRTQSSKDKVPCVLMDNYKHLRKHAKRSPARYKGIFRAKVAPGVKYFPFSVMAFSDRTRNALRWLQRTPSDTMRFALRCEFSSQSALVDVAATVLTWRKPLK